MNNKKKYMKILLKKDVENLGLQYEELEVKSGYARNFLIPKGFAMLALPGKVKNILEILKQRSKKENILIQKYQIIEKKLKTMSIKIPVKTGKNGKLFGSINNQEISKILIKKGISIDKKFINVSVKNIKKIGKYQATIRFHQNYEFSMKFEVISY